MAQSLTNNKDKVLSLLEEAYACRINNLKRSTQLGNEALSLSRETGDIALIAKSLSQLSLFSMIMGEHKHSTEMAREAIGYFEELKDEKGIADAKYNLAGVYYKTDNYHLGLVYLIDCLTIYRKFNDYHNQARSEKSLGAIYEYFGDEKNAVKSYEGAIISAKKAGDLNLESNGYNPLSGIYLTQNKIKKAMEIIEKSVAMKQQTGDIRGLAFAIYGRAKIYAKLKSFREAEQDFNTALKIHKEMGERLGLAMTLYKIASLYKDMGALERSKKALFKALDFSDKYNIIGIKFKCDYMLYEIFKEQSNSEQSLIYLERYIREKEVVINTQSLRIIENYELLNKMESLEKEAQIQREKAEIIEKKNLAEQSARVKQEFLSTMSHEIRTPLNAVITIASLLGNKSAKEEKQLRDSLKFSANNLMLIINDILDFTKLESGKVNIENRPADFRFLLKNIKNTYENLAKEKGLDLYLKVGKDVSGYYEVDETKMSQILGNLITNAIKFTESGHVDISIEKTGSTDETDLLSFKIIDTGIGIPENYLKTIFDSFSQPQFITTRKHGGSGLGLAIVKKLVELYESSVRVSSIVGQGSVFSFDLKLKRSVMPDKIPARYSDYLKNKTVLLAEDNMINAMVAIKLLSNWGMIAKHAKNGTEAIEKSKLQIFDFILMDIHMPDVDGFEATKNIRKYGNPNMGTPIFALTADITAENHEKYTSYFNGVLLKPIEKDKMYDALISV